MRSEKIIWWLYFMALAVLIVALPWSKYLMSMGEFGLATVFILDGIKKERATKLYESRSFLVATIFSIFLSVFWIFDGIVRKFRQFFSKDNLPAIVFSSLWLLHLVGLLYTTDFDYAMKDIRIKLPIFLLPVFLSTMRYMNKDHIRSLLFLFVGAVISATAYSVYLYFSGQYTDIRDISQFISHIRFGLLICIAAFILIYFIFKRKGFGLSYKLVFIAGLLWLLAYLVLASSITGLVIFFGTSFILVIILIFQQKRSIYFRLAIIIPFFLIPFFAIFYLVSIVKDVYTVHEIDFNTLEKKTASDNFFWHNTGSKETENGFYVWIYVAPDEELSEAWSKKSTLDYYGADHKGQEIKYTLIRFLTSKGYHKDAGGVARLTDEEVGFVEDGIASIVYCERPALYVRLYKIIWEYQRYQTNKDVSGHSVMQRTVYWKTSIEIIKKNFLLGVGTGDMNMAFKKQYELMDTPLDSQYQWRSHNQFLALTVGFGIIGLLWFLFSLLYPPIKTRKFRDYFYLSFFIIIVLSMFWEDTIETQAGVTIYAFFSSFLLFLKKDNDTL